MKPNLTDYIYIYYISECGHIIYDRSVSREGLGPNRAIERVEFYKKRGKEAFFTIGFTVKGALS